MQRKTILAALALLGAVLTVLIVPTLTDGGVAVAQQQNNSSYYNQTVAVDNSSWFDGHQSPTLDTTLTFLTRVGSFVLTGGSSAFVAAVTTGLLVFGAVVSITGDSQVGLVGGAVVGVATVAGLSVAGYLAPWIWALVVFAVGVVLATALYRALK